jgi:cyclic beta-1,2-glucan synthetase
MASAEPVPAAGTALPEKIRLLAALPLDPTGRGQAHLLRRLHEPARTIEAAYQRLAALPRAEAETSQATEWLLDNHHVVRRAVRGLQEEFPRGFERKLRSIASGPLRGLPLVYAVAREAVDAAGCRVEVAALVPLLEAFQAERRLTIAEVWAFPALVRLAILERLADAAADVGRAEPTSGRSGEGPARTVASCIQSLRQLETADWKRFFESVSVVERILRLDPAQTYAAMDFETRDLYRKAVEELAAGSPSADEEAVATTAITLAHTDTGRRNHVGYFLVDEGRAALEHEITYRPPWALRGRRALLRHPRSVYLGGLSALTAALLAGLALGLQSAGTSPALTAVALAIAVVPAITVALSLVNDLLTRLLAPRLLPKLDFSTGVPPQHATLVAVPALLGDANEIEQLLAALEIRHLANRDDHVHFALLTDLADAPTESDPADESLLEQAQAGVEALNQRHAAPGQAGPFHLFHRPRQWSEGEGCWMGWERKRGKIVQLNRWLLGTENGFALHVGDPSLRGRVRFVLVLDADTELPRDTARQLIATLAHPLNRAEFDAATGQVVAGYTILQPRVEISPLSADASLFAALFSPAAGLDPYTHAVSDVYQDLFAAGLFVGKGLYEVAAFERSLDGVVPDQSLLSHDLFEGIHGRVGLVTDSVLFEDYPSHYLGHMRRVERWVRGDWQLVPWLGRRVRRAAGEVARNRLDLLARWKVLDNLRRSLLMPALLLWLLAAWLLLPGSPALWTLLAVAVPAVPLLIGLVNRLSTAVRLLVRGRVAVTDPPSLRASLATWLCEIAFLPHHAAVVTTAICRTLVRVCVSRRHLLQWTTAAATARQLAGGAARAAVWREMQMAPASAIAISIAMAALRPEAVLAAAPLLLCWLVAPEIAHQLSLARPAPWSPLDSRSERRLRIVARRTWSFFEAFVGPADQWLPPDSYQEDPPILARRTSSTNIGVAQLATVAALDLGYVGVLTAVLQFKNTLDSLDRMERYRGHFLNWYATADLTPLEPRYVSTVDSGNLVGCMIAVKHTCLQLLHTPVVGPARAQGLLDTIAVLRDAVDDHGGQPAVTLAPILDDMERDVRGWAGDPRRWRAGLAELHDRCCPMFDGAVLALLDSAGSGLDSRLIGDVHHWSAAIRSHAERWQRELDQFLPWVNPALQPPQPLVGDLASEWQALQAVMDAIPSPAALSDAITRGRTRLGDSVARLGRSAPDTDELAAWATRVDAALGEAAQLAAYLRDRLAETAERADRLVGGTDFSFLFDSTRRLFRIGYNVSAGRMDDNHYDLLASEARLASFVAIAKGDVPEEHWLHLGRPITEVGGRRLLLSWAGTMFEYLMPTLLLREAPATLIGHSCRAAVHAQVAYALRRGVPWGISESGYYRVDAQQNYQYRAFGVPGLGFKRGLEDDLVVAPYASLLAAPIAPFAVAENLIQLRQFGAWGRHGCYEAIDFTPARQVRGQPPPLVRSYMAHHQGMILAALANLFCGESLVRRFHAEPLVKTSELLLHERPAARAPVERAQAPAGRAQRPRRQLEVPQWSPPPEAVVPSTHVLSNGRYSVVTTARGDGGSRWRAVEVTRWTPDSTFDSDGFRLYVRDASDGRSWCAFRDREGPPARVLFAPHLVEREGRRDHLSIRERLTVASDADVEIRHLTVTNDSRRRRRLRLIGYAEVVLGDGPADRRHPAFSKLFVESEYVAADHALVFHRRRRTPFDRSLYMAHAIVLPRSGARPAGHDASRETFLGRGGSLDAPAAVRARAGTLAGSTGTTLDPVMALAADLDLPPQRARELAFVTAVGESRAIVLDLIRRHGALADIEWTVDVARHQAAAELEAVQLEPQHLPLLSDLLALLLHSQPGLRADAATLARNTGGRRLLWSHAISGDLPILLVRVGEGMHTALLTLLLRAQAYWRRRGVAIDLVIFDERAAGYDASIDSAVGRAVAAAGAEKWVHKPGGVFVVQAAQLPDTDRVALLAAARVVLNGAAEGLTEQFAAIPHPRAPLPPLIATATSSEVSPPLPRPLGLTHQHPLGGFAAEAGEYVIHLEPGAATPAPWINVVANPRCGFVISESGGGYTWVGNSGENRLTPWRNDLVADEPGEALYLRDEETGAVWSPTPRPAPGPGAYRVRHGAGCTVFHHQCRGLTQELALFVARDDPVKILQLSLTNTTDRPRRITVTYCVEWVLGTTRDVTYPTIVPQFEADAEVLTARNPWNDDFGSHVAFVAAGQRLHGFTADRGEFFGRPGDRTRPAALARIGLASTVQPGVDPCGALQVHVDLPPGQSRTVHFLLGQGDTHDAALALVRSYRDPAAVRAAREASDGRWRELLSARRARTPDPALDLMLNHWLPYQTLASRVWGRTGYCQSSGAFGFRDQLQDVAALLPLMPELCRNHICDAAARQFADGDVLHWWHPPSGAGIRTRCSDDLVWLPFITAHYVAATGDTAVLSTPIPYLQGEPLRDGELERYARFEHGDRVAPLYDHCLAALDRAQALGRHGLPLIGSGDWNDGMNNVGAEGRGESVWLAWFLYRTLVQFAPLCTQRDQPERTKELLARAEQLRRALREQAWDGRWYRRGYYDDGQPLGSARRDECRIDSIAQSWAVLSGAAEPERARLAMQAVAELLVREADRLVLLFTPPFDRSKQEPGYIKGYPPGVRENGGQYTHAALWTVWAFAMLGDVDRAARLFSMLLPTGPTASAEGVARYRVEPYVVAADVYSVAPHSGRGGWTWYTGSSGWAYRFGWEVLLGLRLEGGAWRIDPCIPSTWPGFTMTLRHGDACYEIEVENPERVNRGVAHITLDGVELADTLVPRPSTPGTRRIRVVLGALAAKASATG